MSQELSNMFNADAADMLLIVKTSRFVERRIIGTNEATAEMARAINIPA
jgi:hypothetical protein